MIQKKYVCLKARNELSMESQGYVCITKRTILAKVEWHLKIKFISYKIKEKVANEKEQRNPSQLSYYSANYISLA